MTELRTLPSVASNRTSALTPVVIGVVIVAALYLGREVLVPIALALLLSFVLAPWFASSSAGVSRASLPCSSSGCLHSRRSSASAP